MEPEVSLSQQTLLPSAGRQDFFISRFVALTAAEQCLVLARAIELNGAKGGDANQKECGLGHTPIDRAVEIFEQGQPARRIAAFERLVTEMHHDQVTRLLLDLYQRYLPCLLVMLNAAYQGDDIGVLTARPNRDGHSPLIDAIQGYTGLKLPRRNLYFTNDIARSKRLGAAGTADKKLRVLTDFLKGTYTDVHGTSKNLSRRYERANFYDDETLNLETVSQYAAVHGLSSKLVAVDARSISIPDVWHSLVRNVLAGKRPQLGKNPIIHFFDVDGTLVQLDARMHVINKATRDRLLTITQEQFAAYPSTSHWISLAQELHGLPVETLEMDYSDFSNPERLKSLVQKGREGNSMFKRERG